MIHRSPYPDVAIPDVSLSEFVLASMRGHGDRLALTDAASGASIAFPELAARVEALAAELRAGGFGRGDVAAVCLPNGIEFPVAFLAAAHAGGAATMLNPTLTEAEMARQLADSGASVGLTTPALEPWLTAARPGIRLVRAPAGPAVAAAAPAPPAVNPAADVVALPYSSGTTGTPKGVMLTHRNLVAMQLLLDPLEGTGPADVVMGVLPFFHIYGLSVILLRSLVRGAHLVTLPRFEMAAFLEAAARHGATRLPLVPPLVVRLAREPDLAALAGVRVVISGAAPLPAEPAATLSERLGCLVKQGYGMTELSPGGHMHPEDGSVPVPGSVGLLHPNTECRLVDPASGRDAEPGAPGEIWYRGPQVMKGYLGRPEETSAVLDGDGWLRTGDVGRIDEAGLLYVVDRLKELIKYKGFQVAPAELEALLLTHPDVLDVAVVGRPDPEAGEIPKAFVVARAGAHPDAGRLIGFVGERVAGYKRVREVELVDEIPRSPAGKILRRQLAGRERVGGDR